MLHWSDFRSFSSPLSQMFSTSIANYFLSSRKIRSPSLQQCLYRALSQCRDPAHTVGHSFPSSISSLKAVENLLRCRSKVCEINPIKTSIKRRGKNGFCAFPNMSNSSDGSQAVWKRLTWWWLRTVKRLAVWRLVYCTRMAGHTEAIPRLLQLSGRTREKSI